MENNNELVLDTEKTEQPVEEVVEESVETTDVIETDSEETTEETVDIKKYSDEELDKIVKGKLARQERKIRKEYEKKYGELGDILTQGLEVETIEDATNQLKDFYSEKGKYKPVQREYDDYDLDILSSAEAESIIKLGFNDVIEEVDRLANIGLENMTAREKKTFTKLAEYRKNEEARMELASMGVDENVLNSADYIDFKSKLNPEMSEKDKYELYRNYRPLPEVKPMGSMKGTAETSNKVKDYYTPEEVKQFSRKELDDNPELYQAILSSMLKWSK